VDAFRKEANFLSEHLLYGETKEVEKIRFDDKVYSFSDIINKERELSPSKALRRLKALFNHYPGDMINYCNNIQIDEQSPFLDYNKFSEIINTGNNLSKVMALTNSEVNIISCKNLLHLILEYLRGQYIKELKENGI